MKRSLVIAIWILVWIFILATPSAVGEQRESRKEKEAQLCCKVVIRGQRPRAWMTEKDASKIMDDLRRESVNPNDYRWEDRREHYYPEWWWHASDVYKHQKRKK